MTLFEYSFLPFATKAAGWNEAEGCVCGLASTSLAAFAGYRSADLSATVYGKHRSD